MIGSFFMQSSYSMLKNTIPLETLVIKAKSGGYDFLALCDHQLHGLVQFFKLAKKHDIKPVLGMQIDVSKDLDKMSFLVFVKNSKGYENLLKLALIKNQETIDFNHITTHQSGLIFITGAHNDAITSYVMQDQKDSAFSLIKALKASLDHLYIGLCLDTFDLEMKVAPELKTMAKSMGLKTLPIHQTSYLDPEDQSTYEALIKIENEQNTMPSDALYHFLDKTSLMAMFSDYQEVFQHTKEVIESISFDFNPPQFEMPDYPHTQGASSKDYLKSLASVGLKKRLKIDQIKNPKPYILRLQFELEVIGNMHYDDYFLIVYDFVRYAKTNDILVGPGRGSAAGSLVSYALGITDVDPIKYDLLFERFLNPERMSMPDIDLDFPDDKRDEVIRYVQKTYGEHHMISIATFGTFALRSSIRDIARVMKIELGRVNGIIESVLRDKVDPTDEETVRLLNVAQKIEGLPRHTGTHAAGMILSKQDLSKHIPLHIGAHGFYQSQLEASDLESLGLLKIDFLGIRNLSIIDEVSKNIKKMDPSFDIKKIPLDEKNAYSILAEAKTSGIFQLESQGMRAALRKLKPKTFEDIVAILALYRPGPMENIDLFVRRKEGEPYEDVHPVLAPILNSTYGIIVYQEQIMKIAQDFAGYTLAQADLLRRGISKKDRNILEAEKVNFMSRARIKGHDDHVSEAIYEYIVRFADYGFNRSHSVAYGLIAYQMAYLKANHFEMFMVALLNSIIGNESLTFDYFNEIKDKNIKLLPPDINVSKEKYLYAENGILLPLLIIKSMGKQTVAKIMEIRNERPFADFLDFKSRVKKEINERNIEMLIHSGALDVFGINHKTMIENKDIDHAGYELYVKDFKLKTYLEYEINEKAQFEKDALGFNLSYHPLMAYEELRQKEQLKTIEEALSANGEVEIIAFLRNLKSIKTKNNQNMGFITLDDGTSTLEVTLFTNEWQRYQSMLDKAPRIYKIVKNTYQGKMTFVLKHIREPKTDI